MTKKGRGERVKLQEQWHQAVDYGDNKWPRLRNEGREREWRGKDVVWTWELGRERLTERERGRE